MQQLDLLDPVPDDVREQIVDTLMPIYVEHKRRGGIPIHQDLIGRRSRLNRDAIARLRGLGVEQRTAATIVQELNTAAWRRVFKP